MTELERRILWYMYWQEMLEPGMIQSGRQDSYERVRKKVVRARMRLWQELTTLEVMREEKKIKKAAKAEYEAQQAKNYKFQLEHKPYENCDCC